MIGNNMYVAKNFPLVIIFSSLFAFKPLPKQSDSYSKNISKENLEAQYKKSCSTNKNSFNNVQPSEFPSDYSPQRDRNVEIPINYHVIYVAGDSIYMNVTVDNQPYPHCNWDIRDNDNNTFLLYPGFEFDYPGHSYSIGGILPPGNYSLFLYDEFGTGGVAATVTTSSGQVLASVNMGSWGNYTFLDFTAPEGDYVNGLLSTEVIEEQTEVLNNAYNDFGYTFVTSNIDSAVNAGWYYATDSHKFETGQWDNTDQYLAMAQAMTIDVTQSINYFWTGARQTSGLGVHPWSFPEDDSRHGLFCGNYTIPGGEPGLNLGITGVHEVGHYLGLYHTFENGCSSPGDEVEDTPYQSEANYSCPTSNYSCGSYDDIGNYMDYMDDECLTHFTQGQKDRINWAIETYRPILLENTTLVNLAPIINDIPDQQTNEDQPLTIEVSAYSELGYELSYFAESDTPAMPVYMDENSVAIGVQVNWNGVGIVTVFVIDENGLSDTTSFQVTVLPANDAPTIEDIDDIAIDEDGSVDIVLSSDDVDGDDLTYSFHLDNYDLSLGIEEDTLSITATPDFNGDVPITMFVSDSEFSDSTSFIVTVNAVNDPPMDFSLISPTILDTIQISSYTDETAPFTWEPSFDVDSEVIYKLTITLDYFGTVYTNEYEDITDTTTGISTYEYAILMTNLGLPRWNMEYIIEASDEEFTIVSEAGEFVFENTSLSIDGEIIPEVFALHQNYPNPFNPITSLRYDLPEDGLVNITIYDMMGRVVKTLVNSSQTAGYKSVQWNATNDRNESVSAGLYLYTIQAGEFRQTKKMVLLK